MILRTDGASAAGQQGNWGQQPAGTYITRAQFDALPQDSRAKFFREGGRLGDSASQVAPSAPAAASSDAVGKTMTRAQFDVTPSTQVAALFKTGGKITD